MYILISEFGNIWYQESVSEEELSWCDDGILTIINVTTMQEYNHGWLDLEER